MATDQQTAFYIRQVFAELGRRPHGIPPPPLTRDIITRDVRAAFSELDSRQLAVSRRLSPAQRLGQVCELNRFLRRAAIAAICQQEPGITEAELQRRLLRRMGIQLDDRTRF